ncbi:MAG: hypothetical protein KAH77_06770 [Thiomargarita sp.]|nr:hypothetical protein [Thiomargarita sp.]
MLATQSIRDSKILSIPKISSLKELLEIVATKKERMTLMYKNQVFLAVIPIEDVDMIEQVEDCLDIQAIKDLSKKRDTPIPLETAKKILGW